MNFDLTDEQQMLQAAARDFLAARLKSERIRELAESDDALRARTCGSEMSELNWPGLMVSEEYGGQELGTVELAVLIEQLGYALAPGPLLSSTLAGARARDRGHRRAEGALPGAARDRRAARDARALGRRRRLDARRRHARAGAAERRLRAGRREAVRARRGDRRLLHRRRDAATGGSSSSATPTGVTITPTPTIDATRKQYAVKLDGVKVGEDAAFGGDGAMEPARVRAYVALAAELTGIAQRTLEMAVEYAKERKQFGRPIGSYQAVSHRCAQMLLETENARSAVLLRRLGRRQRARDRAARRLDGEGLRLRRRHARDRRLAPGPRRHRLHLGARPPLLPEARAARTR